MDTNELLDDLLNEPLDELFELFNEEMNRVAKPDLQDEMPSNNEGPNKGNFEHPVTQQKHQLEDLLGAGVDPIQAHQQVYGDIDTSNIESKASLASTLGKIQDDGTRQGVKLDKTGQPSILAKDAKIEKALDQVTHDDLRTPMNQQVPDEQQTPQDQVAEELENEEDYDYNLDVAYLQKYGRA